jgi:1-phosphofructokinase family hexose kinase
VFLTVTPNAGLDRILFIERFLSKSTMRTRKALDAVGGKGFDISVALRCMGQETVALGFQAGRRGAALTQMLIAYGIQPDLVEVEGETRIAHVVIEEALHQHSHITTQGYEVSKPAGKTLLAKVRHHLPHSAWVASGGSLPKGMDEDFFQTLARMARKKNVPVLLDISGIPALRALAARPDILKMNREEFKETFSVEALPLERLAESAARIAAEHVLRGFIITCGGEGILAITPQGILITRAPVLKEVNAAGAGDAASAALMWRLSKGDDWSGALRWSAAAGAATVLTEATAECDLHKIEELLTCIDQKRL